MEPHGKVALPFTTLISVAQLRERMAEPDLVVEGDPGIEDDEVGLGHPFPQLRNADQGGERQSALSARPHPPT